MYEDKDVKGVHSKMLDEVSPTYEKTVGYPTYDFTKAFAVAVADLFGELGIAQSKTFVKNLEGYELDARVWDLRGLRRKQATKAKGTLTVFGDGVITKGDIFSTPANTQFISLETKTIATKDTIKIQAVTAGNIGMVGTNSIIQMPITIKGITSCTNTTATYDGYEAETDEQLKARYYEALQIPATSNNKYHFLKWAKEVVGVGDARVFPTWNGNNSVKVILIDTNKQPANIDLVKRVQAYIDPNDPINLWGTGSGQSSVGTFCTVESAKAKNLTITVNIKKVDNYTNEEILNNVKAGITQYLQSIAFKESYVSFGHLGNSILNSVGVKDYNSLQVNGGINNIDIKENEVAILDVVVINNVLA